MEVSTSVSTIRGLPVEASTSAALSQPSSPPSSALPSPPDSPDSASSFPSLTSSFFFSSADASPPHPHDQDSGLIIPSLTLPAPLRQPTAYGKTLGDMRLLVLRDPATLARTLFEGNEDVVDISAGPGDGSDPVSVLRASTDWVEHRDAHGLEKFEPSHNVEIVDLSAHDDALSVVTGPFHELALALDPHAPPSALLASLLAAPASPLFTAVIAVSPTEPERALLRTLSAHVPVVTIPTLRALPGCSAFRPASTLALRTGLFRAPETLALLRAEAADRFLHWREVERVADNMQFVREQAQEGVKESGRTRWDKAKWEAEWDAQLSHDVGRRLRERTITGPRPTPSCAPAPFDPLHLPSLFMFSLSLLSPLKESLQRLSLSGGRLGLVLVGTLCAGIGIGLVMRSG
ncbi:hypothetical protein FA95DRAFT_854459 [Auriscalpium vulgare]|uniref:Uncharacterized protein n=1 Tax=Auriscalpium vulgare TaxID=40419 RepID=A0ACB8S024_9AGAM|nr:hypothetical protein FA95DRAFT_854459 [Auriscalpium vulgare]